MTKLSKKKLSIFNLDPYIPEEYKVKAKNKYFDAPQAPAMVVINAATMGGKSNLTLLLLTKYMIVDKLIIFLMDDEEDKVKFLESVFQSAIDKYNEENNTNHPLSHIFEVHVGLNDLTSASELIGTLDKKLNNVVMFDDLVTAEKAQLKNVRTLFTMARKRCCSCFFLSQSWFEIPKTIRLQATNVYLFDIGSATEKRCISSEMAVDLDYKVFKHIFATATAQPFSFLSINRRHKDPFDKYRIQLSEQFSADDFS